MPPRVGRDAAPSGTGDLAAADVSVGLSGTCPRGKSTGAEDEACCFVWQ